MTEADTCRQYVVPKLQTAGWEEDAHRISEQVTFTDGRIIPLVNRIRRGTQKRADYLLRYTRDFPIVVVEANAEYRAPAGGLGQAKVDCLKALHALTAAELDALLPAAPDRAFAGGVAKP